jgi:hypothetical protein
MSLLDLFSCHRWKLSESFSVFYKTNERMRLCCEYPVHKEFPKKLCCTLVNDLVNFILVAVIYETLNTGR